MKKTNSKYSADAISIREFIDKMNEASKMLKEAYVYEDDVEDEMDSEVIEEPASDGKEYVDAIRQSALKGIQVFAQDVDSPSYQFFKKVFMLADKVLSEKEGENVEE